MTLYDPMWVHARYVQERAEDEARKREQRKQLPRSARHTPPADWLGAGFIYFGDQMHAFGERLCTSCPCPEVAPGSGSSR